MCIAECTNDDCVCSKNSELYDLTEEMFIEKSRELHKQAAFIKHFNM
jgi:hypothetical protein